MSAARFLECKVVATSNITLSTLLTVDGLALAAGDQVLVVGQTTASQNGVYAAAVGSWTRITEASLPADFLGMTVVVRQGTSFADTMWQCTTDGTITVGTTSLAYKQIRNARFLECDVIATSNITLSNSQTIDGVAVSSPNRVLVVSQTTGSQNGLYVVVNSGAWVRTPEALLPQDFLGMTVAVRRGTTFADTMWQCLDDAPITVGSTSLSFKQLPDYSDKGYLAHYEATTGYIDHLLANTMTGSTGTIDDTAGQTLTLATAHRWLAATGVFTADRTKTLSTGGAIEGDTMFIRRKDASVYRLYLKNPGPAGGGFLLARPGTVTFAFVAATGDWIVSASTVESGDISLDAVRDFGAVGDGVADDTAALAAWVAAISKKNPIRRGTIPPGTYLTTKSLRFCSNGSNFPSFHVTSESSQTLGFTECVVKYVGPETDAAVIMAIGCNDSVFEGIIADANYLAKHAFWWTIEPRFDIPGAMQVVHAPTCTGVSLTFSGNTITRASGSFLTDGFCPSQPLYVTGTTSNNSTTRNITKRSANVITVDGSPFVSEVTSAATLTTDVGDESSEFLSFIDCQSANPRDVAGAACVALGPELNSIPSGASDCANGTFIRMQTLVPFYDYNSSHYNGARLADAFVSYQANNVIGFTFIDCSMSGGRHGWNLATGVGTVVIRGGGSSGQIGWLGLFGSQTTVIGLVCEQIANPFAGSFDQLTLIGCRVNYFSCDQTYPLPYLSDDGACVVHPNVVAESCYFFNFNKYRAITSIDPATDRITVGASVFGDAGALEAPLALGPLASAGSAGVTLLFSGHTITRTVGTRDLRAMFRVGSTIVVSGTTSNNANLTVTAITETSITVSQTLTLETSSVATVYRTDHRFYIYADGGDVALPASDYTTPILHNTFYFARDIQCEGSGTFSFKIATSAGGTALNIASAGSGALYIHAPNAFVGNSIRLTNSYIGFAAHHPAVHAAAGPDSFAPIVSASQDICYPCIVRGCQGGSQGLSRYLADQDLNYGPDRPLLAPAVSFYQGFQKVGYSGLDTRGKSCIVIDSAVMKAKFPTWTNFTFYVSVPGRLLASFVEVERFVAAGMTSAILEFRELAGAVGDIMPAMDLMADPLPNSRLWYGFSNQSEVGTKLRPHADLGSLVQGGYRPAREGFITLEGHVNIAGATYANLTAGKIYWYLEIERFPHPDQIAPFSPPIYT